MRINRINLIAEMARQKMTVNLLSEKANVSRVTISALRSGKCCHMNTIKHIAKALNVAPEYLVQED